MAIAWKSQSGTVTSARAGSTATFTHTMTYPANAIGDVAFIFATNWNNTGTHVWNTPTGYTAIMASGFSSALFYRVIDGTEGASVGVTMPAGDAIFGACSGITVFTGGIASVDTAHTGYISTSTASTTSPDLAWTSLPGPNDMGFAIWFGSKSGSGSLGTYSFPVGYSTVTFAPSAGSTNNVGGGWGFPTVLGSGAHGSASSTVSQTDWEVTNVVMRGIAPSTNTGFFEMFE